MPPEPFPPAAPAPAWRRHAAALAVALLLVLLAHAVLLGGWPVGAGTAHRGGVEPVFTVRRIDVPAPAPPEVPAEPQPVPAPMSPPQEAAAVSAALSASAAASEPAPQAALLAPVPTAASTPPAVPVAGVDPEAPAASAPGAAVGGGQPVPVYATRLPPAARLRYDVRRGALAAEGELVWAPGPDRYVANFEGAAFSMLILEWHSEGGFDAAGVAPERFTDRRLRRSAMSANFRRDQGRITFSGPQVEYPLVPGAQDRLSWLVQLAGIVAADPARFGPGSRIEMFVVGARADGDVWTFEVQGREALDLPAGRLDDTLRLKRAARRPFETEAEVWLDPGHAWLPARVRLTVPGSGDALEFQLAAPAPGGG